MNYGAETCYRDEARIYPAEQAQILMNDEADYIHRKLNRHYGLNVRLEFTRNECNQTGTAYLHKGLTRISRNPSMELLLHEFAHHLAFSGKIPVGGLAVKPGDDAFGHGLFFLFHLTKVIEYARSYKYWKKELSDRQTRSMLRAVSTSQQREIITNALSTQTVSV